MIEMGNIWETMIIWEHIGKVVPPQICSLVSKPHELYLYIYMCGINPRNWSYWHQLGDFFFSFEKKGVRSSTLKSVIHDLIGSMVLVYLPTKLGHVLGFLCWDSYSSTMDPMGMLFFYRKIHDFLDTWRSPRKYLKIADAFAVFLS